MFNYIGLVFALYLLKGIVSNEETSASAGLQDAYSIIRPYATPPPPIPNAQRPSPQLGTLLTRRRRPALLIPPPPWLLQANLRQKGRRPVRIVGQHARKISRP